MGKRGKEEEWVLLAGTELEQEQKGQLMSFNSGGEKLKTNKKKISKEQDLKQNERDQIYATERREMKAE